MYHFTPMYIYIMVRIMNEARIDPVVDKNPL